MKCKVTQPVVENHFYNKVLEIDGDAFFSDGIIHCSSKEKFDQCVELLREYETDNFMASETGPMIAVNEKSMTIKVLENKAVLSGYEMEESDELYSTVGESSMPRYKENNIDNSYIGKWKSKIYRQKREISAEIRKLNTERNKKDISNERRSEIIQQQKILIEISKRIDDQIEIMKANNVNANFDAMTTAVQIGLDTMEYLLSDENINVLTLEQIGILRKTIETNGFIIENYYSPKNASRTVSARGLVDFDLNDEQNAVINEQHTAYNLLLERYNQYLSNKQLEYIKTNGLLAQKLGIDMMTNVVIPGKENVKNERFKKLFGGAELKDKGFWEYLGLNMDRSFSSTSLLEQTMQMEYDRKTMQWNQFAYEKSERLVRLGKELKKYGINIETWEGSSFLREKDKNGKDTENLITAFVPGFLNKVRKMRELNTFGTGSNAFTRGAEKATAIYNDFDVIDITKLPEFTDDDELKEILVQLGFDAGITESNLVADARYQEELKSKLGPCYEDYILDMKNRLRNFALKYQNAIMAGATQEEIDKLRTENPITIISKINEMNSRYSGNMLSEFFTINVAGGHKWVLDYNKMTYIPKKDSDYNQEFRRNFCGTDRISQLKRDLYREMLDIYSEINATYLNGSQNGYVADPSSRRYAKISPDFVDKFDDAQNYPDKLKALMYSAWDKCKEHLYTDHFYHTDEDAVAKNYMDIQQQKYKTFMKLLHSGMSNEQIDVMAAEVEIKKSDYTDNEEYLEAIAKEHSMRCFSKNILKSTTNLLYLYAAQKAREEFYETAKLIERQYQTYTINGKEGARETANKQMHEWIMRVIQKIEINTHDSLIDKKLKDVIFLRTLMEKTSESTIIQKVLNKALSSKMDAEEKRAYNELKKLLDGFDRTKEFEFKFNYVTYKYDPTQQGDAKFQQKSPGDTEFYSLGANGEETFNNAYNKYIANEMDRIGHDITFKGIIDLVQSLVIFKALAGISSSGIFNRVEGHLAAAEVDASGYLWTPGNLAKAEKLFFGAGMHRYVNENGDPKFFPDSKGAKRRRILQIFADRTGIFQDMKNQFDKTIDTSPGTTMTHNWDLYQFSITNPEFKNQMGMTVSCMFDLKVKDNDGNWHPFITDDGEFTLYDIKDGKLVLKEGFDRYNKEWIEFSTIKEEVAEMTSHGITKKVKNTWTDIALFVAKQKDMISTIQGDYRKTGCVGYSSSLLLKQIMTLKRWYPSKVYRAWNSGVGYNIAMENVDKEGNVTGTENDKYIRVRQSGKYYDSMMYGGLLMTALPVVMATQKLDKGIVKTSANTILGLYLAIKTIKSRLGADHTERLGEMAMADFELLKNILFETIFFLPRTLPFIKKDKFLGKRSDEIAYQDEVMIRSLGEKKAKDLGIKKEDFETEEEYEAHVNQYGKIVVGNFRSVARETASRIVIWCIGLIAKAILWDPDDGDDDERRQYCNWVDNNVNKILQSTNDCMYMLNSLQDKYSVDSLPLIRWVNDITNFMMAAQKGDTEKLAKYGLRSLPLPRGIIYEGQLTFSPNNFSLLDPFDIFKSGYEYKKDEWSDKIVKDMKTGGEYTLEREYKAYRDEAVKAYVKKYKKKKFSDSELNSMRKYMKRNGYKEDSVYDLDDKKMKTVIRNTFLPNRSKKAFRNHSTKQMVEEYKKLFDENDLSYNWFRIYHESPGLLNVWEKMSPEDNDEE